MNEDITAILTRARILPVLSIEDAATAPALARALSAGGLSVLEVTMRTPACIPAIKAISAEVPECTVGAGTVLSQADLKTVTAAGARFAVSPGATPSLLRTDREIPLLPGVATASDIMAGLEAGLNVFKFFPAEAAGGAAALTSFAGPFAHVRFCPTGGVNAANINTYRKLSNVVCVGGSWMIDPRAIAEQRWDDVTAAARAATAL